MLPSTVARTWAMGVPSSPPTQGRLNVVIPASGFVVLREAMTMSQPHAADPATLAMRSRFHLMTTLPFCMAHEQSHGGERRAGAHPSRVARSSRRAGPAVPDFKAEKRAFELGDAKQVKLHALSDPYLEALLCTRVDLVISRIFAVEVVTTDGNTFVFSQYGQPRQTLDNHDSLDPVLQPMNVIENKPALADEFWEKLSAQLYNLSPVGSEMDRHLSWMSAEDIFEWWKKWGKPNLDAEDLNRALLKEWQNRRPTTNIRFAKYPSLSGISMLWGHEDRVGKGPTDLNELANKSPLEFESISLPPDAPQVFVSYSLRDVHFAARVRWLLNTYGMRAWIAGEALDEDEMLIEGVRYAMKSSAAVIGLVSRNSLTSAWFETEIYSSQHHGKQVLLACDSTDDLLMEVLDKWSDADSCKLSTFEKERVAKMRDELAGSLTESRFSKYQTLAERFLERLKTWTANCELTVFPRRPLRWQGCERFTDFEATWKSVARGLGRPSPQ